MLQLSSNDLKISYSNKHIYRKIKIKIKKEILTTRLQNQINLDKEIGEYIKENENKDPKEVVIDEVIGQSIPIYLYEIAHGLEKNSQEAILFYIYIFVLFRFFDIKKPFPVNFFDKNYKNSFGVIIDDVIAGLYVVLTLIVFMIIKSKFFT